MLSRAGLRSIRAVPRAAPLAPKSLPSQALARRSVGGASDREAASRVPKDVVPLVAAVSFALVLGLVFGMRQFKKDTTLRTHREDAVDREATAPPPPPPDWEKSPQAGGRHEK